ncbi:MAG: Fe-S protein assembly co-chaperone HscB [Planctomycetes bacterium]|nr:Fe-S protein assembly co-chaperone HscB [Planctomycetota bacterium]
MDPFATLELEVRMDLDPATLEGNYLRLSRLSHPDLLGSLPAEAQIEAMARSARLNDAYRVLRDPWHRARAILDLRAPGAFAGAKRLSGEFLAGMMDLAEEIATARGDAVAPLRARLRRTIDGYLQRICEQLARGEYHAAAVSLHESNYHRKALHDLDAASA